MAGPLTQSDILFPSQLSSLPTLSSTLNSLKRSTLSIHNRLNSITSDSAFVIQISDAYGLPLVANERCGSWYIPPEKKVESVYFKSTDGHSGEWKFSLRRLNLQVLDLVGRAGGCVIVDSTRRGKSMPDALSKTVPIWCCVMNRAIFQDSGPHELHTPPQAISESEHSQIEKRIDGFVRLFLDICKPDIQYLRSKIQKPLRPIWVTQASSLPETAPSFTAFHPIVLCTASRRVLGGEMSEGGYIQGAADDHEAWANELTPQIFWANKDKLLNTNEEELPSLINGLIREKGGSYALPVLIKPTSSLYISSSQNADLSPFDVVISCTPDPLTTMDSNHVKTKKYLHLRCRTGKLGSRDLRSQLATLLPFFTSSSSLQNDPGKILVCCPTGKDLSVGAALMILCLYADKEGRVITAATRNRFDKTFIRQRLTWITTSDPGLNASRGTLQSVNAVLMSDTTYAPTSTQRTGTSSPSVLALVDANGTPVSEASTREPEQKIKNKSNFSSTSIPSTIFTALRNSGNPWTFTRKLTSALPTQPSGTVTGTATFTPYGPESLLYSEEGIFEISPDLRFTARRKYVYQLKRSQDSDNEPYIAVHFFDDGKMRGKEGIGENGEAVGGLFVEMGELVGGEEGLLARNREQHLCAEDLYAATWRLGEGMVEIEEREAMWWEVRYDVKGPKKDYVSETKYMRM